MIPLTEIQKGASGIIAEIAGGRRMLVRLDSLGIRPGKPIRKISQQALRGPVVVEIGRTQVAVGFGMASHIMVQPSGNQDE
jgi:ferrous iron transport protein A